MKYLIALLIASPAVFALESNVATVPPAFILLKCNAIKIGTIWASFGHSRSSDSDVVTTFPTEYAFFDTNNNGFRTVYNDLNEARKIPVIATESKIRIEFPSAVGGIKKTNVLTAMLFETRDPNSYLGNWVVSTPGQPDQTDVAYCTVY